MHRLDEFDRRQQHHQPAHPRFSGESVAWRDEHGAATNDRFGITGARGDTAVEGPNQNQSVA